MRERWGAAFDPSVNPDLDDISRTYVEVGAQVVVAETDGQIVACGILLPEAACRGRILRVSVRDTHRRRGLARQIVEELTSRARALGMEEVVVSTDSPWTSAVELYRACGFAEVGSDATDTHFLLRL